MHDWAQKHLLKKICTWVWDLSWWRRLYWTSLTHLLETCHQYFQSTLLASLLHWKNDCNSYCSLGIQTFCNQYWGKHLLHLERYREPIFLSSVLGPSLLGWNLRCLCFLVEPTFAQEWSSSLSLGLSAGVTCILFFLALWFEATTEEWAGPMKQGMKVLSCFVRNLKLNWFLQTSLDDLTEFMKACDVKISGRCFTP